MGGKKKGCYSCTSGLCSFARGPDDSAPAAATTSPADTALQFREALGGLRQLSLMSAGDTLFGPAMHRVDVQFTHVGRMLGFCEPLPPIAVDDRRSSATWRPVRQGRAHDPQVCRTLHMMYQH